ncbi:MAG: PqiC family protein [Luteolibacter sp.]
MKKFLVIGFAALLFAGCIGKTPTFYLLTADGAAPTGGGTGVGVGPIMLAEYVDRENIVIQSGPNTVQVAESHLWAGDLEESINRVLATNIGRRLNSGNVRIYPWQYEKELQYQVFVDIRQFLAGYDGNAQIEATYRIYSLPGSRLKVSRNFVGSEPIENEDYASVVAAQSRLLSRLSEEIVKNLKD